VRAIRPQITGTSCTIAVCLLGCLPLRIFYAGKIAEMPAAQAQPQKVSDLPPKADMCGATTDVRFGPKADIRNTTFLKMEEGRRSSGLPYF
jgi:hypothetical protein